LPGVKPVFWRRPFNICPPGGTQKMLYANPARNVGEKINKFFRVKPGYVLYPSKPPLNLGEELLFMFAHLK